MRVQNPRTVVPGSANIPIWKSIPPGRQLLSTHTVANAGTTVMNPHRLGDTHDQQLSVIMEEQCLIDVSRSSRPLSSIHTSSHHGSTPTRRHEHSSWLCHCSIPTRHLFLVIILTCFLSFSSASIYIEEEMVERSPEDVTELLGSTFARLARSGTILVDQRPPPEPKSWELDTADDLRRRNTENTSSSNSITKGSSTSTLAPTTTSSGLVVATTESASALPTPFDTGFNNNITTNCQSFMTSMLANTTFKSCLPFSLLLQVCFHPRKPIECLLTYPELQLLFPSFEISRPHHPNP